MRSLGLSGAVLVLLVALLAGCGGGGGGESTAAATSEATEPLALSKAELITQGDAICAEVNAAVGAAGSTSAGAGEAIVQVAGLYGGMVERLKGLGPPREEGAGYSEFIASAEALAQAEDNVKLAYEREEAEELTDGVGRSLVRADRVRVGGARIRLRKMRRSADRAVPSGSGEGSGGEEESAGGVESEVEEAAPEEAAEAAPEEAPPVEEESAGGGAAAGGGAEGGGTSGGSSGGIGPG